MNILDPLFIITIVFSAAHIPFIKKYNNTNSFIWLIFAIISYICAFLLYIKLLKNNNIATTYPLIKISAIILVIFTGILLFNEKLSKQNILGMFLGLTSICLLSY
uniref:Small multidrug resistance protein n=1 Tax=Fadolivirus 2 TaxID=2740747 RepID=A0A7D3UWK5_9VIRU|nr:small multidrug resistance protein [Fadolivirus 2]